MKCINSLKTGYRSDKVLLVEWIVASLIGAVILLSFNYVDLKSLTIWSTNLLDVTFEGRIMDFYSYSKQNIYGAPHGLVGCDIFPFLPWSVWNIPIWIAQYFFGMRIINSPIALAWSKLFLVFILILTVCFAYKICMLVTGDKTKSIWAAFLSFSSAYVYIGVCYAGQNDILLLLFGVISFYSLLRGKRNLFYLFASLSVAIKPFFLFAYVALILLTQKSIFKAFLQILYSFSILLIFKALFAAAPAYSESLMKGPSYWVIGNMFAFGYDSTLGKVSLFAVSLFVLYFISYITVIKSTEDLYKYAVYFSAAPFLIFALFSGYEFYRVLLLVPFLYIMFAQNFHIFRINIILDTIMSCMCTLALVIRAPSLFSTNSMANTIFESLAGKASVAGRRFASLCDLLRRLYAPYIVPFFTGVFVASGLLLLIINYPKFKFKLEIKGGACERWLIWLRMAVIVPFVAGTFFLYFWMK